ncbi:MAG: NADH-quinone oxidoreductase subunit NuoN [Alphaproteobacteria bacterium]|nr:NADH-quinone oxidoreductase subunit NuoN [Alphaproteobacteria bacterium]
MSSIDFSSLGPIVPEIFLSVTGMILLVLGVLRGNSSTNLMSWSVVGVLAIAMLFMANQNTNGEAILNGMFVHDRFTFFMKFLVISGLITCVTLSVQYLHQDNVVRFEYPILMLFAGVGMMLMVSSNDMLSLYMGLELQSLSLYVLAAIRRDHMKSAEAGMKYFVLGAISSGMLLFGISLIYGFTGTTNFHVIGQTLGEEVSIGAVLGFVFIMAGLAFKISAVPFHMWTPDVYQGAPTSVTAFFAIVPKVAAIALIIRLLFVPFASLSDQWFQIMWFLSLMSMMVGAFAALRQDNIKRLLAYSSIGNMGYVLIGIVAGGASGLASVLVYLTIYMVMTAGTFGIVLCMRRDGAALEKVSDLAGLSRNSPWLAYPLAILMFSMSGIPPLAGFFGKFMVFKAALESGTYVLAVLGVLTSVVAAYYYLRIIKTMFFDDPVEKFDKEIETSRKIIIGLSLFFVLVFIFNPSPLINIAQSSVVSMFGQ